MGLGNRLLTNFKKIAFIIFFFKFSNINTKKTLYKDLYY